MKIAEYLTAKEAAAHIIKTASEVGSDEVIAVRNLGFVPNSTELYFLVPKTPLPLPKITAFAVDMDGTSTTTEPLALHSLEYMVRRFTGLMTQAQWHGLDPEFDIPFVIGNSNFMHTEFLMKKYAENVNHEAFAASFIEAILWTWANMTNAQRLADVRLNAVNCGLGAILTDKDFLEITQQTQVSDTACERLAQPLIKKYSPSFVPQHFTAKVSAAMDIYYHRYHALLRQMQTGDSHAIAEKLLGDPKARLVEAMPGYGIFLCLIKGWLGDEAGKLAPLLRGYHQSDTKVKASDRDILNNLSQRFSQAPAKIALVTASIAYEAHVVMHEVIKVVCEELEQWPISDTLKSQLKVNMHDYLSVFQSFVTASSAWEARLKPHRDLYSIALHEMSIAREDYASCIAIEDTEPGILSARAAGFGATVALPNHDTNQQNYSKASVVLPGGLSELILDKNILM